MTDFGDYTVDDQFKIFFESIPEGVQPIIMLKPGEEHYIEAIRRTQGKHTPVIEVGKSVGELVRNKAAYLSDTK